MLAATVARFLMSTPPRWSASISTENVLGSLSDIAVRSFLRCFGGGPGRGHRGVEHRLEVELTVDRQAQPVGQQPRECARGPRARVLLGRPYGLYDAGRQLRRGELAIARARQLEVDEPAPAVDGRGDHPVLRRGGPGQPRHVVARRLD